MSTTQPMSPAARRAVRCGVPVAMLASAALSFQTQWGLGTTIGWERKIAWMLPTAVIIYEAVATIVFFGTDPKFREERKHAGWNALLAVVLSLALNSTQHLLHPGSAPLSVVLGVSAVPNIVLAALLHISMRVPAQAPEAEPEALPEPAPELEVSAEVAPEPPELSQAPLSAPALPEPEPAPVPEPEAPAVPEPPAAPALPEAVPVPEVRPARSRRSGSGTRVPPETLEVALLYIRENGKDLDSVSGEEIANYLGVSGSWGRAVKRALKAEALVPG